MLPGTGQVVVEARELGRFAALGQHLFELELPVEMVLDHALVAAGDEDEVLDAGCHGLIHDMLDQRTVDHRQHLFRHRLGRGQEAGAKPRHWKHGLTDASSHRGPR